MPRKGPVTRRDVLPDPIYNSKLVSRLINKMMVDGKRGKSQAILYSSFDLIRERSGKEPMEVFDAALKNIMPVLEVKARRVGGANYQVPIEVRPDRRTTLGLRWLVNYSRLRGEKTMEERLANEIETKTQLPLAIESVYRYVVFLPSKQYADVPVPNRFFAVGKDGELKVRGLECRRHDTPPLLKRMQHEVLAILAEADDFDSYVHKIESARIVLAEYQERLSTGDVDIRELIVSKRITKEPRDYQKAGVTAIAAQQLFGSGVKLRPGQTVEYIITNSECSVPNDRVRAFALWEGWFGYDRKKYGAMLREAFEPFILCLPKTAEENFLTDSLTDEELKRFPLFAALTRSRS